MFQVGIKCLAVFTIFTYVFTWCLHVVLRKQDLSKIWQEALDGAGN